jgi:hypothetical protein
MFLWRNRSDPICNALAATGCWLGHTADAVVDMVGVLETWARHLPWVVEVEPSLQPGVRRLAVSCAPMGVCRLAND